MLIQTLHFLPPALRRMALACSLALMLQLSTRAASYSYVNVADTSMGFSSFTDGIGNQLDVNDNGTVSFWATTPPQSRGGIYTGNGGPATVIMREESLPLGLYATSSINDAGTVTLVNSGNVMTANGGTVNTIADRAGPLKYYFNADINNHDAVAITAQRGSGNPGYGAYVIDGGVATLIAEAGASGTSSNYMDFFARDFNNAGQVAMFAYADNPNSEAIYIGSGGPVILVVERLGAHVLGDRPSINDAGNVVYVARSPSNSYVGLYKYNAGVTTTLIAPSPSSGISILTVPKINNRDMIAYFGSLNGRGGYITGDGSTFSNVISIGDPLFGSTVKSFEPGYSLNDRGDIAFLYTLDSGRRGVALAVVVPEPSTISFGAIGAAGLIAARFRPRRSRR